LRQPAIPEREVELFRLRPRLLRFFSARGQSWAADELADESILRVLGKLRLGEEIETLDRFTLGVARFVLLEHLRSHAHRHDPLPDDLEAATPEVPDTSAIECLEQCLSRMTPAARTLLLRFHGSADDTVKNKDLRKRLAADLGISMNALFLRKCRLRRDLEACVRRCLIEPPRQESGPARTAEKAQGR